ncbi:MAG: DNA polymerase III subunit delta [Lachnospiraceae bacterium]|nr:DNA polymerase III subunit delta [Lachnospiraceae bacterium]
MQRLNQDIKQHTFQRVYCLFGEEEYLKRNYKNRLIEAIAGDDTMNVNRFSEKEAEIPAIIEAAETMPFFAEYRLVVVENSGLFKREADRLVEYLDSVPETTVMIFVESQMDKRSRLYKKVNSVGCAVEMTKQTEKELQTWILRILKQEGKQISGRAMELFLEMAGDGMENIRMELEKLISYVGDRDGILPEDVQAICTPQISGQIFDMIGAVAARRQQEALRLYYDLLTMKEPPMRILFLIARQFNQLLQVKEAAAKTRDKAAIAKACGLNPYVAGKMLSQASNFSREILLSYLQLCVQTEEDVKTGRLTDRLAVELLIVQFSQRK